MESCRRLCRAAPVRADSGISELLSSALRGDYSFSKLEKSLLFRNIDVDRLALPPDDFPRVDVMRYLSWPFTELFSPEGVARLRKSPAEVADAAVPTPKVCLDGDPRSAYPKFVQRLVKANICKLVDATELVGAPEVGAFALYKSEDADRLVINAPAGNALFHDMSKLQEFYSEIISANPERASACGLSARLMDIPGPAEHAALPAGATAVSEGDFTCYFYTLGQLEGFLEAQVLPPVPLRALGVDADGLVRPVIQVLAMGNTFAALLAHLVHKGMMGQLVRASLRLRLPTHSSERHLAALADLRGKANALGRVRFVDVPTDISAGYCGMIGVERASLPHDWVHSFEIPIGAFSLEPAGVCDDPTALVQVRPHILDDRGYVGALTASRAESLSVPGVIFPFLLSIYIDDSYGFPYPGFHPRHDCSELAVPIGDMVRLCMAMVTAANGFLQNTSKQRWTSSRPATVLGVGVEFLQHLPLRPMRWAVRAEKRLHTAALISGLLASGDTHMDDNLCDHIMGKMVWAILVNRPLLSIFFWLYRRRHDPAREPGLVWLCPKVRCELKLAVALSCFFETMSLPLSSKVAIFDASGSNSSNFGGFGVVSRGGLTAEIATEILGSSRGHGSTPLPSYRISDDLRPPSSSPAAARATSFLLQDKSRRFPAWRVVRAGEFRRDPGHINCGEATTGGMAASFLCGARGTRGHSVLVGGDNTASLCCLRKGRSGSRRINGVCGRVAVYSLLCSIHFIWFWIPSKANPADEPSRLCLLPYPGSAWQSDLATTGMPPHPGPGLSRFSYPGSAWQSDLATTGMPPHPGPPPRGQPATFSRRFAPPTARQRKQSSPAKSRPRRDLSVSRARPQHLPRHPWKGKVRLDREAPQPLAARSVKPDTLERYLSAWSGFSQFYESTWSRHPDLESALEAYVELAWETDGLTKGDCKNLLSGAAFLAPELSKQGVFARAWRAISGWEKLDPTRSWNPITRHMNLVLATLLAWGGDLEAATAILLAFHVYARGGEVDGLQDSDIALPGDSRLFDSAQGSVLLWDTKAGRMQSVSIDDPLVLAALTRQRQRNATARPGGGPLFASLSAPGSPSLLERFKGAQLLLGFPQPLWVRHSERHGGATNDFVHGLRTESGIQIRGRWADLKTMKIYLNGAQARLQSLSFPPEVVRRLQLMGDPEIALRLALGL